MAKYRKIPVIIIAKPYTKGLEDGFECVAGGRCPASLWHGCIRDKCDNYKPYIKTLEGNMYIEPTDMIITGVKGERYPCKKDIFDMTYEKVEE